MCVNRLIPLGIQEGAGPSLDMKRVSTAPCDTEGCTNGDATERRSAYAKATADKYDPPSLLRASAYALCAMADKTEDKYEIGGEGVARHFCRALKADEGG